MKIYANKLYSLPNAAKRAGIEENQLRTLISVGEVKCDPNYKGSFIRGKEIPKIKNKWDYFNR